VPNFHAFCKRNKNNNGQFNWYKNFERVQSQLCVLTDAAYNLWPWLLQLFVFTTFVGSLQCSYQNVFAWISINENTKRVYC
jgi:hypothetical protein